MTVTYFVDTNVLIYARDSSETEKQPRSAHWLKSIWIAGAGRLSHQVLNEFYSIATRRLDPPLPLGYARADIASYLAWKPHTQDEMSTRLAWDIQDRYGFSWWDCLIVAAARLQDCRYLLTEDLQHGQDLDGVTVLNPFEASPEEFPDLTAPRRPR